MFNIAAIWSETASGKRIPFSAGSFAIVIAVGAVVGYYVLYGDHMEDDMFIPVAAYMSILLVALWRSAARMLLASAQPASAESTDKLYLLTGMI